MAVYRGLDGEVSVGANKVGETTSFTVTETGDTIDTTAQQATGDARTYMAGLKTFTGSIEAHFDHGDTGQGNIEIGEVLTFNLYPTGDNTGHKLISGSGIVTSIETSSSFDNQAVGVTFQFQGTGVLSKTTISA